MTFTATTVNSAAAWRPDYYTFSPADVIPEALIIECSTYAGQVEGDQPVVRVGYVDDATADFVAEAAEIPEAEPDLAEVLVATGKVSQLVRLSREQWAQPDTAEQLSQSVGRALVRRADLAFMQQVAPTPPALGPSTGILNVANVVEGEEVSGSLDALVDLVAELQTNLSTPTHVILSPTAWAEFRKLKTATDYNSSLIGAGTTDAQTLLLSLPVVVNVAVPTYTGMVIDRTAIVSAYGPVMVSTSEHQFFSSDSVAVRATWRIGQNLVRPNRCGTFSIAGPGS
ncbi:phage major capsid protein [Mycobacterium sp. E3198]|uniref:phage major capsid protein n=1 Tax=Mycobacterium sp. E3198 TaxID=1834143 RepID=UPI0007FD187A|nr:phage major capsid protein [Mycobacterium sp. E3198]OBG25521.1 major capsid protein [Mycobacterium sp. E3198]